jgi:hypothetical protein
MIQVNDTVKILSSKELAEMKLQGLVGKIGVVIEDLNYPNRKNKGYIIRFNEEFAEEFNWFIPAKSCNHAK